MPTMLPRRLARALPPLLALAVLIGLLAGCGGPASANAGLPLVTIPKGQGVFAPYILPVQPGARITVRNDDTIAHSISTTPDHASYLNPAQITLTIPAGKSVTLTLTHPGLYDYYDPAMAQWNGTDHHLSANANTPAFPLTMEGIIWVQGHISGLPASITNLIPGKDLFASEFLAIPQGGAIYWYNADTDPHTIAQATGWSAPINPARFNPFQLNGSDAAPPYGETHPLTFNTPGLYYYYCSAHAQFLAKWHRAAPIKVASEFPIPMEGFVLVVGK